MQQPLKAFASIRVAGCLPFRQVSIVGNIVWHVGEADHAPIGGLHRAVVCPGAHDVADGALLHAKISQV